MGRRRPVKLEGKNRHTVAKGQLAAGGDAAEDDFVLEFAGASRFYLSLSEGMEG